MRRLTLLLGLALSLQASFAFAATKPEPKQEPEPDAASASPSASAAVAPSPARSRLLPAAAAVVPGFVLHGSGQLALGQTNTAKQLMLMEGVGLGLFLSGGLTVVFTGASRYFTGPAATAAIAGFGLFSTSYLVDIYGSVATEQGAALSRNRGPARWETELGYRRIQDPEFSYRDFLVERVSRQIGPFRVNPSGWFSTRGDTARYRLEGQYRLLGNVDNPRPRDLSFLDVTLGFVHQRNRPERFNTSLAELSLDARYDFARLGPTLRGAFMELGAGYALGRIDYQLNGLPAPHDLETLLLGRIGFGVTLRGASAPGSELVVYYDHRHDDYVAGLKLTGIPSGIAGHFGVGGRWFVSESVGVALDAQAGSAYLAGASLLFRTPARPATHEVTP
jgi:hypothetical protein